MGKYVLGWILGVPALVLVVLYIVFRRGSQPGSFQPREGIPSRAHGMFAMPLRTSRLRVSPIPNAILRRSASILPLGNSVWKYTNPSDRVG